MTVEFMRRIFPTLLHPTTAVLVTTAMFLFAGSAHAVDPDWDRLLAGEVLVEPVDGSDGLPGVKVRAVVNASAKSIWATLVDYNNFTRIFKEMDHVKVLEQDAAGAEIEFRLTIFLKQYHYVLYRHYEDPGRKLTWRRLRGDLNRIEGAWEILDTPVAGVHLIVYESYVDPGGWIPLALVRWRSMGTARDMVKRLRQWIDDHPLPDATR